MRPERVKHYLPICIALLAALTTLGIARYQGVGVAVAMWRCAVSGVMVFTFQQSLLTAWQICSDEDTAPQTNRV